MRSVIGGGLSCLRTQRSENTAMASADNNDNNNNSDSHVMALIIGLIIMAFIMATKMGKGAELFWNAMFEKCGWQ